MKKISIIIVNYNTNEYLKDCLQSLPKDAEIIIVDNNSLEKPNFPNSQLILNEKNLGFSKAVNLGIKISKGDFILLLNPDTKLLPGSLEKMVSFYDSSPDAGIVVPRITTNKGVEQKSIRRFPTIIGAIKEYIFGISGAYGFYLPAVSMPVDVAVGACMLIKRDILESMGGLNEKYFLYYEDIDLCKRMKEKGLKTYFLKDSVIYHKIGASSDINSYNLLVQSSKIYHGWLGFILISTIIKLGRLLRSGKDEI